MKRIVFLLLCAGIIGFAGCSQHEIELYSGTDGVYFYVPYSATDTDRVLSSSLIGFLRGGVLQDVVDTSILVRLIGRVTPYPRQLKVVVVPDSTTAVEGLNYEPLADYYTIPAGVERLKVPLRFLNHENIAEEERSVYLQLVPTDDFVLGLPMWRRLGGVDTADVTRYTFVLSGKFTSPPGWSGSTNATTGVESGSLGVFSMKKYLLICEVCNVTYGDFTKGTTWRGMIEYIMCTYLQAKYDARDPVLEEDGRLMWITGVTWTSIPGVPWNGEY